MLASPRTDDVRARSRRAAGLPEVQSRRQAPGCDAAPANTALSPSGARPPTKIISPLVRAIDAPRRLARGTIFGLRGFLAGVSGFPRYYCVCEVLRSDGISCSAYPLLLRWLYLEATGDPHRGISGRETWT